MKRTATVLTATAGLLALGTSAAIATGPPYTITVGSATSGTHSTSLTASSPAFSVNSSTLSCSSVSTNGTLAAGSGLTTISSIAGSSWSGCVLQGIGPVTITQQGTALVQGTGTTASTGTTDVITASVNNFNVRVTLAANPSACAFTISGSAPQTSFDEGQQRVNIGQAATGSLSTSAVVGCGGRVTSGSPNRLAANLTLTSPVGPVRLS